MELETDVASHTQNIERINLRIPSLEAEKKRAVTARDFKTAGGKRVEGVGELEGEGEGVGQFFAHKMRHQIGQADS